MKNKGFTLMEVLAILVILGIIMVITIPKIKDVMEDAKKKSVKNSAIGYESSIDKYYLDKVAIDPYYYIPDESYTPSDLKNMGIQTSGTEPDSNSWVTISDNNITEACLQYSKYKVDINNGNIGDAQKGTCKALGPSSFEEDSWSTIAKAVRNGELEKYHIGDKKKITMLLNGEEKTFTVRISNMSKPEECDSRTFSQTACGFVVEFQDIVELKPMHSTSTTGGWEYTDLRQYLLGDFYSGLPSDLKSVISNTYVIGGHPKTTGSLNTETNDKLYIPSAVEIYGEDTQYDAVDTTLTRQLDYYEEQGVTTTNAAKAVKFLNHVAKNWWLRSASKKENSYHINIQNNGTITNSAPTWEFGLSPLFRIDG